MPKLAPLLTDTRLRNAKPNDIDGNGKFYRDSRANVVNLPAEAEWKIGVLAALFLGSAKARGQY